MQSERRRGEDDSMKKKKMNAQEPDSARRRSDRCSIDDPRAGRLIPPNAVPTVQA
jgi:hypothetical protein